MNERTLQPSECVAVTIKEWNERQAKIEAYEKALEIIGHAALDVLAKMALAKIASVSLTSDKRE